MKIYGVGDLKVLRLRACLFSNYGVVRPCNIIRTFLLQDEAITIVLSLALFL